MADLQDITQLLNSGTQLTQAKRFREAEPLFRQVLSLEPRHTGAAQLLAVTLYFTGSFHEARHLFKQLTSANSPLESDQKNRLLELTRYCDYEIIRDQYWQTLKLARTDKVQRVIKKRHLDYSSLEAFHLYLYNGRAEEWLSENNRNAPTGSASITTKQGRTMLQSEMTDADATIGTHLEAIQSHQYLFIPFSSLKIVEIGGVKRWMSAQIEFRTGGRDSVYLPLTYRDSMQESARGVQEGVETITKPLEEWPAMVRAFGQKQFRGSSSRLGISEIARIEFETR